MAYFDLSRRLGIPDDDWEVGVITVSGGINTRGGNASARYTTCLVPPHCEVSFSVSYYIDPEDGTPYGGYINICEYGFNGSFISGTVVESTSDKFHRPEGITIITSDRTAYIGVSARFITSAYNGGYIASCDSPWALGSQNDGYPYNSQADVLKDNQMVQPYPDSWWRFESGYNDGYPFNMLIPDIPYSPPRPIAPVKQRPYICLYSWDTPQDGFDGHGMFVLTPTSCKITEELNGRYEFSMEHPIDAEGRWQYIRENYIIKAMGQLFTIRTVQQIWKGASGKIIAKGDHIFYQCGDGVIHRGSTGITGTTVASLCQQAVALTDNKDRTGLMRYTFHGISNLSVTSAYRMTMVDYLEKSKTMTEFVMGNKGILEACEGEIYRNNFDYSIYSRKERTFDNAFDIRIGKNLTGIKRTIDITTQCTYLDAYNDYGDGISYDVPVSKMQVYGIPHHIVREKVYSYPINRPWSESSKREVAWEMLKLDAKRDFDSMSAPLIAYEIDMKEVKNNPDYSEVVDLGGYTVGNGGLVHDEYLGTIDIRVTKSTINAITGEVEQLTFGNVRSFIAQPNKQAIIDVEPEIVDVWFQVTDSEGGLCFDREGAMIIEYEGV